MHPVMEQAPGNVVDPHLLEHLVDAGRTRAIEASEDIYNAQGIKLLAKGARIAPELRERVLQHRLNKPFEACVTMSDALSPIDIATVADELLAAHPLLQTLCHPPGARPAGESLAALRLSAPVRTLFSVYARHPRRLRHAVAVALVALGLARRCLPGEFDRQLNLALAGLLHDIGELYLDPALFDRSTRLDAQAWRQVVSHPAIAHRVLRPLEGVGALVADCVLQHHERLSGYGYPSGLGGQGADPLPIEGQMLGVGEWLVGILESGKLPGTRTGIAMRVIADDFDAALLAAVADAAEVSGASQLPSTAGEVADAEARIRRIASTLQRHQEQLDWIDSRRNAAGPVLRATLDRGRDRMRRLRAAFASVGLSTIAPEVLLREIGALNDPQIQAELLSVVHELEWRLREIERETLLRAAFMSAEEAAVLAELMARVKAPR